LPSTAASISTTAKGIKKSFKGTEELNSHASKNSVGLIIPTQRALALIAMDSSELGL
jgi:hypothetical protein